MPGLTDIWTTFTWTTFDVLRMPQWVIPITLSLITVAWVGRRPLWLKGVGRLLLPLLVGYVVLSTPIAAAVLTRGLTMGLPPESDRGAEVIVVLCRGDELGLGRYDQAMQLWQAQRAPKVFVTSQERWQYMADRWRQAGLPSSALMGTTQARTTYEEARSAAALLQPAGVRSMVLMTDAPHLLRSMLTFRAQGFVVSPHRVPLPETVSSLERSLLALREYGGLVSYAVLGRLASG